MDINIAEIELCSWVEMKLHFIALAMAVPAFATAVPACVRVS